MSSPIARQRPRLSAGLRAAAALSAALLGLGLCLGLASGCAEREVAPVAAGPDPAETAGTPAAAAQAAAESTTPEARHLFRGVWVLCEGSARTLEDPQRIEELIANAQALGVTDLFVQVYRGGRAWYDATRADPAPYREIRERTGIDPLRRTLDRARASGLRVHAWVNVFSLNANRDAPIVRDLGEAAVLVDRRGRSLLDYPGGELPRPDRDWYRMGTPGLYLDPGAPGVRERLVETFAELVDRYPDLDGIHLDYIRYPGVLPFSPGSRFGVGLDFGYGEGSRLRFRADTGLQGPYRDPDHPARSAIVHANAWDRWRREQVTGLVRDLRTRVLADHPELLVSAAVIAYADRAYLSLNQDWRSWVREGLVDFAVPMVYTLDDALFRHQVESFAASPERERIWMGTGTWLFASRPARAVDQLSVVREVGSTGEVLFSYDALLESQPLFAAVRDMGATPVPGPTASATSPDGAGNPSRETADATPPASAGTGAGAGP